MSNSLAALAGILGFVAFEIFRIGMELVRTRKELQRIADALEKNSPR